MQITNYTDKILINSLNRCNTSIAKSQAGLAKMSGIDGFKDIGTIINNIRMPRMEAEVRGTQQGNKNIQDGVSLIQMAENSLDTVQNIGQHLRELATRYSNEILNEEDKKQIEEEAEKYYKEIGKTINNTKFNNINIFEKDEFTIQTGAYSDDIYKIKLDEVGKKLSKISNEIENNISKNSSTTQTGGATSDNTNTNGTSTIGNNTNGVGQGIKYVNISKDGIKYYTGWVDSNNVQQKGGIVYNNQTGLKRYEGEIKDGSANGKGIRYYDNGAIKYKGGFKDGLYDGYGEKFEEEGYLSYRGQFINGERNGEGISFDKNGIVQAMGIWKDGKLIESKSFSANTSNVSQINLDFSNLKSDTISQINVTNNSMVPNDEAIFKKSVTNMPSTSAESVISNTSSVNTTGNIEVNNSINKNIQYINITQDGKTYYTGWVDEQGVRQKYGKVHDKSTGMVKYEGEITNGFADGKGIKYFNTGMVQYKGDFKNGLYGGKGESYSESGYLAYRGSFENGKRNGEGIEFDVCGNITNIGVWKDDMLVTSKPIAISTSNKSQINLDFSDSKSDTITQYNVNKNLISDVDNVFKTSVGDTTKPAIMPVVLASESTSSSSTSTTTQNNSTNDNNNQGSNITSNTSSGGTQQTSNGSFTGSESTKSTTTDNNKDISKVDKDTTPISSDNSKKPDDLDISKWLSVDFIDKNILKPVKSASQSLKVQEDILNRRTSLNNGKIEVIGNDITNKTVSQYQELVEKLSNDTQNAQIVSALYQKSLNQRRESIIQLISSL